MASNNGLFKVYKDQCIRVTQQSGAGVVFPSKTKQPLGFTLLELLIVLIIITTVIAFAIPSWRQLLLQSKAISYSNSFLQALYYARNEAITRNEKIIFCKSNDQKKCNGHWGDGQIVLDSKNNVLHVFSGVEPPDQLIWNSSGGQDTAVTWLPTGYTNGQRGTFYYCIFNTDPLTSASRSIVLSDSGRAYSIQMSTKDYNTYCHP